MAAARDTRPAGAVHPAVAAEVALAALPVAVRGGSGPDPAVGVDADRVALPVIVVEARVAPGQSQRAVVPELVRAEEARVRVGVVEPVEEVGSPSAADPPHECRWPAGRRRCDGCRGRGRPVRPSRHERGSGASPPAASALRARRRGSGPATARAPRPSLHTRAREPRRRRGSRPSRRRRCDGPGSRRRGGRRRAPRPPPAHPARAQRPASAPSTRPSPCPLSEAMLAAAVQTQERSREPCRGDRRPAELQQVAGDEAQARAAEPRRCEAGE